jgi:predicted Zn-dependent peptidase
VGRLVRCRPGLALDVSHRMTYLLFDVLADLYSNPVLDPAEIESEKAVIREEIAMVRDQPSQYLDDLISEAVWGPGHPLGRSITGTEESLEAFRRSDVFDFHQRAYCGANTVISVAGNIEHDAVYDIVSRRVAGLPKGAPIPYLPGGTSPDRHRFAEEDGQEQAHLALSFRNVDRYDRTRYAQKLLNVILGENMSSRLFQAIREQKGLCYEVQSDLVSFSDAGLLQIYLALSPENLGEALKGIADILADLRENGVSDQELEESKAYLVGQNRISLENTSSQMMWAGETMLIFDEWIDPEDSHRHIEEVTSDELRAAASLAFDVETLCSALIGPATSQDVLGEWLSECNS